MNIIEAIDLKMYYRQRGTYFRKKYIKALNGVSFNIKEGIIFGIVGETGSGKTTIAKILQGLIRPSNGSVKFRDVDIFSLRKKDLRNVRKKIQTIFQDPYGGLEPRFKVKQIIEEPLKLNHIEYDDRFIIDVMEDVGLTPVEDFLEKYPHQLSGGQRQRVLIARAIVLKPEFLIADEPASMLDVSLRAGILNYFKKINKEKGTSMLLISHDIGIVSYLSQEIAVLYRGKIVEKASRDEIINNPLHPYTKLLIESVPETGKDIDEIEISSVESISSEEDYGCSFYPRCKFRTEICKSEEPKLINVGNDHYVRCHLFS